jgi:NAD-dependent dihydropyrimidine dehydrogenase PreA subunit
LIKILILAANPKNTSRLRLDEEVREIDAGLQRARRRDEFELRQQWATRPQDIRRAMLDFTPNIVHFCGHGQGSAGIALEDQNGQTQLVSTGALAEFFELFADSVQCVLLNACYSETQAQAIARHIEFVIGMAQGVGDQAAIEFAVAFYDALGAGRPIRFAYRLACNAVRMAGVGGQLAPVIMVKGAASVPQTPPTASAPPRQDAPPSAERTRGTVPQQRPRQRTVDRQPPLSTPRLDLAALASGRPAAHGTAPFKIDGDLCISCGACEPECAQEAIVEDMLQYTIDPDRCTGCGDCAEVCPVEAISQ